MKNRFNWKKLVLSLILDAIGVISFSVPGIGEFQDVIWAPLSAYILMKMYPGQTGKIAGTIEFIEEILPFSDFIPTFTLTFIYTNLFQTRKDARK